ncbi:MAG: nicotinate-nucleotide diphosphorylase (carboxylating), partial [Oscillospiraceae bacterium]|nr:nicotinate-nucleotide diphosphorylase (carboxylating) [Oscillospiraceae bacterium]
MKLPQFYVDDLIKRAISEDINYVDVTTDYLIPEGSISSARLISKDEGVVAGIEIGMRVFELLDSGVAYTILKPDGSSVSKGDVIAELKGSTASLLKGERTALNLMQHLSGIATATNQ